MFVKIDGRLVYLWRAVDAEGEVLDVLVQSKRDKRAALKLMRKLLKKMGFVPDKIVTDDLRSTARPRVILGYLTRHQRGRWRNNRAENSHQPTRRKERKMQGFRVRDQPSDSCPSTLPPTTPSTSSGTSYQQRRHRGVPSLGHANMARGRRCGMIAIECTICRVYHSST